MAREGDCAEPRVTAAISQLRCWGAERRARRGSWGAGRVVCIPFLVACVGRPRLVVLVRRCLFWSRAAEKSTGRFGVSCCTREQSRCRRDAGRVNARQELLARCSTSGATQRKARVYMCARRRDGAKERTSWQALGEGGC
jgi:hypothetical protein